MYHLCLGEVSKGDYCQKHGHELLNFSTGKLTLKEIK